MNGSNHSDIGIMDQLNGQVEMLPQDTSFFQDALSSGATQCGVARNRTIEVARARITATARRTLANDPAGG
jgi:hypothetical protein